MVGWQSGDTGKSRAFPARGGGEWGKQIRQREQNQLKDAKILREIEFFWQQQENNGNRDWERGGPPRKGERFLQEEERELFTSKHCLEGIDFNKYSEVQVQRTGRASENIPTIETFEKCFQMFQLPKWLEKNVNSMQYHAPTPAQKHAMPAGLVGRDVMACAQTGSGKTAAFLLPLVASMDPSAAVENIDFTYQGPARPMALIMAPTRELVSQIFLEARKFCHRSPFRALQVYGGVEAKPQLKELSRGVDLIIATPGRLIDFVDREILGMDNIIYLVLDEADRMLDMGFEPQIRQVVERSGMPDKQKRQTMFFSATFPKEIQILSQDFLYDYIWIAVGRVGSAVETVTQEIKLAKSNQEKPKMLIEELVKDDLKPQKGKGKGGGGKPKLLLVFTAMKRTASWLVFELQRNGYTAVAIHGDLTQVERERNLNEFKSGYAPILVATDVASRGLDIPDVFKVINYDLPSQIDDYVHRIGRTGRIGNRGESVSFFLHGSGAEGNTQIAGDLLDKLEESGAEAPSWLEEAASMGGRKKQGYGKGGYGAPKRDVRDGQWGAGDGYGRRGFGKGKGKVAGFGGAPKGGGKKGGGDGFKGSKNFGGKGGGFGSNMFGSSGAGGKNWR